MASQRYPNQGNQPNPGNINSLNIRDEVSDDVPSELPEQMGGQGLPTLLPGTNIFRIPNDVMQVVEPYDEILKDENGQPIPDPANPTQAKVRQMLRLHFSKDYPLLVVGGEQDGHPVAVSISTQARNRARRNEAPFFVSDMAYLFRESLGYRGPLTKNSEWITAIKASAGKVFRAEHGLSAYCNPEKVRYINDPNDPTNVGSIQDPSGQKGCGGGPQKKRIYTSGFRLPAAQGGGYSDIVYCPFCAAKLRGFFTFERFLKPTAGMETMATA